MNEQHDVIVIGGGPAGSTAAALLARAGLDVLLLERDRFPRYHVGESIIPSCVPVLRLSGALDKVAAHGFQVKRGGVFRWAADEWIINWADLVHPDAWSWQVDRDAFDDILLHNAVDQGADVRQSADVKRVIFDGQRPTGVEWSRRDGGPLHTAECRFLIDASGRAGLLSARHFRTRRAHSIFQNTAVWGYWTGARLLPDGPEGAINIISGPDGWYWGIPLAGERLSLGYVTHKRSFSTQRSGFASLQDYYLDRVAASESVRWLVESATFTPGVRAEQDYSYVADQFCGPGHLIAGDAACFLDPLLATGVHLATYSALLGAASTAAILLDGMSEADALAFYEYAYRRAYCRLIVLVSHLYQRYDGEHTYFWRAQKLVRPDDGRTSPRQSFMDITTGFADLVEAHHAGTRVVTDVLVAESETAQAVARDNRSHGFPGLDMAPMWDTWHHTSGPESSVEGTYLVTEPRLGLSRQGCRC